MVVRSLVGSVSPRRLALKLREVSTPRSRHSGERHEAAVGSLATDRVQILGRVDVTLSLQFSVASETLGPFQLGKLGYRRGFPVVYQQRAKKAPGERRYEQCRR